MAVTGDLPVVSATYWLPYNELGILSDSYSKAEWLCCTKTQSWQILNNSANSTKNCQSYWPEVSAIVFIFPIAITYTIGQIIKLVCIGQCICISVCAHFHGCISWSIFTKIGRDVKTPKSEKQVRWGQHRTIPSPICPRHPKPPFLGQKVLKIHANINNPISAVNVRESPKFLHLTQIGAEEHDGDVRFYTGMRNEKYAI